MSRRAEIAQSKQDIPAKALYFKRENEGMLELNGGSDFYARDVAGRGREGAASLKVFPERCEEGGVAVSSPERGFRGNSTCASPPE